MKSLVEVDVTFFSSCQVKNPSCSKLWSRHNGREESGALSLSLSLSLSLFSLWDAHKMRRRGWSCFFYLVQWLLEEGGGGLLGEVILLHGSYLVNKLLHYFFFHFSLCYDRDSQMEKEKVVVPFLYQRVTWNSGQATKSS